MPSFQSSFMESGGQPITYKRKTLYVVDKLPVGKKSKILVRRISTNSEWRQGIGLDTDGSFSYGTQVSKKRATMWADTSPEEMILGVQSKEGLIWVKNLWDRGDGTVHSWHHGAAMIVEELPNGRRYYCNDGHPDENFDDIVFEIIVLEVKWTPKNGPLAKLTYSLMVCSPF